MTVKDMTKERKVTRAVQVRMSLGYWNAAKVAAEALETTPTSIIRLALRDWLRKNHVPVVEPKPDSTNTTATENVQ